MFKAVTDTVLVISYSGRPLSRHHEIPRHYTWLLVALLRSCQCCFAHFKQTLLSVLPVRYKHHCKNVLNDTTWKSFKWWQKAHNKLLKCGTLGDFTQIAPSAFCPVSALTLLAWWQKWQLKVPCGGPSEPEVTTEESQLRKKWQQSDKLLLLTGSKRLQHSCPLANNVENINHGQIWACLSMTQKVPFSVRGSGSPRNTWFLYAHPSSYPKWHTDWFRNFSTAHDYNQQTYRYQPQPPVLRPLPVYRAACISWHLQLRTGVFCWHKVLLPAWQQPAHFDLGEDAGVLLNSFIYTVSIPSTDTQIKHAITATIVFILCYA